MAYLIIVFACNIGKLRLVLPLGCTFTLAAIVEIGQVILCCCYSCKRLESIRVCVVCM